MPLFIAIQDAPIHASKIMATIVISQQRHFEWVQSSMLSTTPHNYCVPLCHAKDYSSVSIEGIIAEVTFHKFPTDNLAMHTKRRQRFHAILCNVSKYMYFKSWKLMKMKYAYYQEYSTAREVTNSTYFHICTTGILLLEILLPY